MRTTQILTCALFALFTSSIGFAEEYCFGQFKVDSQEDIIVSTQYQAQCVSSSTGAERQFASVTKTTFLTLPSANAQSKLRNEVVDQLTAAGFVPLAVPGYASEVFVNASDAPQGQESVCLVSSDEKIKCTAGSHLSSDPLKQQSGKDILLDNGYLLSASTFGTSIFRK